MCMIKLIDLLKEVQEGARVTFDDKGAATAIDISFTYLDGEQLNTYDGRIKKHGYEVFYSLESDPKASSIKASEDALKYNSDKIKPKELKELLSKTLLTRIPKVDYIGYLESKGGLNQVLLNTIKELYDNPEVVHIEKMEYNVIDNAVDWEKFNKHADSIKRTIINYLYKTAEKAPPYKIRKSNELQSALTKQLYSKYNIGLHPSGEGEKFPPVYNVIVECLTKGKVMLIIDDNMHTGDDFYKLFGGIEAIKEKVKESNEKPVGNEEELSQLDKIKANPKFKSSKFLQDKFTELEKVNKMYRERVSILNANLNKSHNNFYGYVLYNLKGSDLKG
jgi:hypothetical protein